MQAAKYLVEVLSDYKNLLKFTTTKTLTARHVQWIETLSEYDIQIRHKKEIENRAADALSRSLQFQEKGTGMQATMLTKSCNDSWIPMQYIGLIVQEYEEQELQDAYRKDQFLEGKEDQFYRKNG